MFNYKVINKETFTDNNNFIRKVGATTAVKVFDNIMFAYDQINEGNYGNFGTTLKAIEGKGNRLHRYGAILKRAVKLLPLVWTDAGNTKKDRDFKGEMLTLEQFHGELTKMFEETKKANLAIDAKKGKSNNTAYLKRQKANAESEDTYLETMLDLQEKVNAIVESIQPNEEAEVIPMAAE